MSLAIEQHISVGDNTPIDNHNIPFVSSINTRMPQWVMSEPIVISGISGRYPESDNIEEFANNLFNNVDMVVEDERRWPFGFLGLPRGSGKMKDVSRFDAQFFGVNEREANLMDSQIRIMMELAYEAIWDAGIDPNSLRGTNTGTFVGCCFDEIPSAHAEDHSKVTGYKQTHAQRLAYLFDLKGPSVLIDSGFCAFHEAIVSLRNDQCDRAIVAGINMSLRASTQFQFYRLNMISPDGHCKCLDASANGYAKGEACVVLLLQKRSETKRIYATVIHTRTNTDGYKELGITYPSWESQCNLIEQTYIEAAIDPKQVNYIEAHCTGTQAGDPVEMRAITKSMCSDRTNPLLIGAIKSNIGHTEASSGLCSLSKVILAFENKCIPANLHMTVPNPAIDGLMSGILKPIIKNTPFNGGIVGLNCFGFGGVNVHAIVMPNDKELNDQSYIISDNIPRLVQMCGRSEDSLQYMFTYMENNPKKMTREFLSLINDISKTSEESKGPYEGMSYRGFTILENSKDSSDFKHFTQEVPKVKSPIWFVLSGMGCQWPAMAKSLMSIDVCAKSITTSAQILSNFGINLMELLSDNININSLSKPMASFVSIAAVQIALIDLLQELNIKPDGIVGHSIGELTCAYADGCLTAEETILTAYWRGKCVENANLAPGHMAAVGLSRDEATNRCPSGVVVACHNADDSVTISGDRDITKEFVAQLLEDDIFARDIDCSGIAFHSPILKPIGVKLKKALEKVITEKRLRSSQWISSSFEQSQWDDDDAKYCSPDYFVHNLLFPVLFRDALSHIPRDAIIIEIAPHHLLHAIIKRNLGSDITYIPLMKRNNNHENIEFLLSNIGKLYCQGYNPLIETLYPKVQYPVPRGTASISPLIKWDHSKKWIVTQWPEYFNPIGQTDFTVKVDLNDAEDAYLSGHCVDGRVLFPATGYLMLAWEQFAKQYGVSIKQLPIEFEDVVLHRATILPKTGITKFEIRILETNGSFTISEGGTVAVTGKVRIPEMPVQQYAYILKEKMKNKSFFTSEELVLKSKDLYKELRLRGYDYGQTFQGITNASCDETHAKATIKWNGIWITFADAIIQMAIIGKKTRGLYLPVRIESLRCDPRILFAEEFNTDIEAVYDYHLNIAVSKGIEFRGIKANLAPRKQNAQIPIVEKYQFIPHTETCAIETEDMNYLIAYCNVCNSMVKKIAQKFNIDSALLNGIINTDDDTNGIVTEQFLSQTEENPELLKALINIYETDKSNDITMVVKNMTQMKVINLLHDLLYETFIKESFIRPQLDIVLENLTTNRVNILEVNPSPVLMNKVINELIDTSSINKQLNYSLLCPKNNDIQFEGQNNCQIIEWIMSKSKIPPDVSNMDLIVYKDITTCWMSVKDDINLSALFESMFTATRDGGFVLVLYKDLTSAEEFLCKMINKEVQNNRREQIIHEATRVGFNTIGIKSDSVSANAILLRKVIVDMHVLNQTFIPIEDDCSWIEHLKKEMSKVQTKTEGKNIWLIANDTPYNGIVGMVNCLRQESGGNRLRCIFNFSANEKINFELDFNDPMLVSLVKKNLVMNVHCDGQFGSFRHFTLNSSTNLIKTEHAYLNVMTRGDLSSLRWFESQHKYWPLERKHNEILCHVYYAPLNFRDIMLATGKLPPDALPGDMALHDCILGLEFSGRDENGNRVMGMIPSKGLATTLIMEDADFIWPIPSDWTMEEACTVPVAYATAYYALIIRGKLQRGETVLIHSGSGGVGTAAIAICLSMECHIYTTVGSNEKREFLKKEFPKLNDCNFASSRDVNFESYIMKDTDGRGVDIVLNSLAEEKLQASLRCLSQNGRFLEIGKFDLSQNNALNLSNLLRNKQFHGILLDCLFQNGSNTSPLICRHKQMVSDLIHNGIRDGVVRPLKRTLFEKEKVEDAFRYMASGKHTGKVIIKIRDEETFSATSPYRVEIPAIPRTVFHSNKSYIITGGLGGFGLELANWMAERGARNLVLTSRTGPKEQYQYFRIMHLQKIGVKILISTKDASNIMGAKELIDEALSLGPIGGIFNLAMILRDALFENQTLEDFEKVCAPKANTAINLDTLSRELCPEMDYFVAFSSISCGRGNAGQSNYGYANSVMERVCDLRRSHGLHGMAIQWGAIGDVGVVSENMGGNDVVIGGTLPQRMPSCLSVLDQLLQSHYSVCSSIVKADKKVEASGKKVNLIKTVAHILGIKDYSTLDSNTTLGDLGMDSLMGVEVKQALERDYELIMSMQEIRKLNIKQLGDIGSGNISGVISPKDIIESTSINNNNKETNIFLSSHFQIPSEAKISLNNIEDGDPIIFLPPIDGSFEILKTFAQYLNRPAVALNWTKECTKFKTIEESCIHYLKIINEISDNGQYDLIGYSFGGVMSYEIGLQLERCNLPKLRSLILLDSSPVQFMIDTEEAVKKYNLEDDDSRNVEAFVSFLMQFVPIDYQKAKNDLQNTPLNDRSLKAAQMFIDCGGPKSDLKTIAMAADNFTNKMIMLNSYSPNGQRLNTDALLIRADEHILNGDKEVANDYGISETITGKCEVIVLKGNHTSFITNNCHEIAQIINKYIL